MADMTSENAIKLIRYCMCEGRLVRNTRPIIDEKWQAGLMAIESIEKLQKIEQIINDPLIKARGSIGTNKIREILGEEDKPCQMQ